MFHLSLSLSHTHTHTHTHTQTEHILYHKIPAFSTGIDGNTVLYVSEVLKLSYCFSNDERERERERERAFISYTCM